MFDAWLYHDRLAYIPLDGSSMRADFDTLSISDEHPHFNEYPDRKLPEDDPSWKRDPEDAATWPWYVLIRLYVFGDRFDIRGLRATVIRDMIRVIWKQKSLPSHAVIRYAFDNSPDGSPLRKFLIEIFAYCSMSRGSTAVYEHLPQEFVLGMLVNLKMRTPLILCQRCHSRGKEDNELHAEDLHEDDQPRFHKDICFYHEHKDDGEREACRIRRKAPQEQALKES